MIQKRLIQLFFFASILLYSSTLCSAQGSAGSAAPFESRLIVDQPTAGVLTKNTLGLTTVVFAEGGILADLSFAPLENFNIGIGYSGSKILGSGDVTWQGLPSLHLRYRLIDETITIPALTLGLQTQGRGVVPNKRFETSAPGFFATASKQFKWFAGTVSVHGGAGYSVDLAFNGIGANVWGGIEQSLGPNASFVAEINPTLDDAASGMLINIALRWAIVYGVTLEVQARDLLIKLPAAQGFTRTLGIEVIRRL